MRRDADAGRDDLRAYAVEQLGDPGAVLVLDEAGFVKGGATSAGVQRQYSGTAGRVENCQVGAFLAYASRRGHALIDRALDLPERWAADPVRRAGAGVPEEVAFATKPELGRRMLAPALDAGVPWAWATGDSVYGSDAALRRFIERSGRGYVPAVTSAQRLGPKPVAAWLADGPADGWQRLSAGDGAKGPRLYDRAWLPDRAAAAPGWQTGLLIRRKIGQADDPTCYLTLAPAAAGLADLARAAGTRWTIEACVEAAKGEVGLDQYEVRSWTGWHRQITLALLAHADLTVVRRAATGGRSGARPRRRAAAPDRAGGAPARPARRLVWARPPEPAPPVLAWSTWRRRHRQRARRCHRQRRRRQHEPRL